MLVDFTVMSAFCLRDESAFAAEIARIRSAFALRATTKTLRNATSRPRSNNRVFTAKDNYLTAIIDFGRPKNVSQCSSASGKYRRISVAVSSCVDNTSSSVWFFGQSHVCPSGHHTAAL